MEAIVEANPRDRESHRHLCAGLMNLADIEAKAGNHVRAALAAERLARAARRSATVRPTDPTFHFGIKPGQDYYNAAKNLAQCVDLAAADRSPSEQERNELSRRYADRAIALLRQAVDDGFSDRGRIDRQSAFDSIRADPRFKQIMADLEARAAKPGPS
jgi:hypothetical protein